MITEESPKRLEAQVCPLCGQEQDIIFNGHVPTGKAEDPLEVRMDKDRGYSFCNCRNIYFTDWKNMRQAVYDEKYTEKYNNDHSEKLTRNYASEYFGQVISLSGTGQFLEIGAVTPFLLCAAKEAGFKPFGLDIIAHNFPDIFTFKDNFESFESSLKFNVIWASHIFEHFKDPIAAAQKCFDLLSPGGVLFVAMPDPYFIDFAKPYLWGHWHLEEHHIMWDRDSFCQMMEELGFKTVMKKRNPDASFVCIGDYHLLFQKPAGEFR